MTSGIWEKGIGLWFREKCFLLQNASEVFKLFLNTLHITKTMPADRFLKACANEMKLNCKKEKPTAAENARSLLEFPIPALDLILIFYKTRITNID